MNVLLVDDDYFVVAALEKKIDWAALGINQVYTAYNIAQAQELLGRHTIEILICDIEMPQGSGLELLAWIREEQDGIQTIFLTNYADFNYAQKAIELQSFDYFLKPIEFDKLTLIIQKAIAKVSEQQDQAKAAQEGYYWQKNRKNVQEHFWRKLMTGKSAYSNPANIAHLIAEQHLSYGLADEVLPVLFHIFPYEESLGKKDKDLFDFALLNVLHELFQDEAYTAEAILEIKEFNFVAVLKWKERPDSRLVESGCATFIQRANHYLKCDACCMVATTGKLEDVSQVMRDLLGLNEKIIKYRNQTFLLEHYRQSEAAYSPPDLALLERLLEQNNPDAFLEETGRYLRHISRSRMLNASVLSLFRLDMVQLVYAYLKSKEILAHKMYTGRTNDQLFMQSLHSIEDMESYLRYLVTTATEYRSFAEQPKSVVDEIKNHIRTHCGDELSRTSLAEIVYLNPDYLARLFKKETGISLGNYIIQARIKVARHLLETTQLSVNAIAGKTGYTNYSYFAKLFRQEVGCTPVEYRKNR
ncbi:response regulator [Paenibacillus arenilitoris]|uniref:Response regulator n=1 Tax=Paenibacillus arenilitoris TaxID=2772299 RepID=A0A927H5J6_9BACL|nr:helix-turn-helix domain-containing protein [Paenibacillus arenilitoris]MBD2868608.1 response regulator [Paenibacillus arenilitoris]